MKLFYIIIIWSRLIVVYLGQNQSTTFISDLNLMTINDCACVCLTNQTTYYHPTLNRTSTTSVKRTEIVTKKIRPIKTTTKTTASTATTPFLELNELNCKFPFKFNNKWHDECIRDELGNFWCSIDKVFSNRRADCEEACPLLARNLVGPYQMHSSCLQPNPSAKGQLPVKAQIDLILDKHNSIRSQVQPTAENMRRIYWDYDLARLALRWAENCEFSHDCYECRTLVNNQSIVVGQNAYASFGADFDQSTFWSNMFDLWLSESNSFQYGSGSMTGSFSDIGHYTQIINADTARIGCAASECSGGIYAYCNYATGQSDVNQPYVQGSSCRYCLSSCQDNLCQCDQLCQIGNLNLNNCACET